MKRLKPIVSVILSLVLLVGNVPTVVFATDSGRLHLTEVDPTFDPRLPELFVSDNESDEPEFAPEDIVRVSIVLNEDSAIDKGYPVQTIVSNKAAVNYRDKLYQKQEALTSRIEETALDGEKLNIVTNLTLVANLISADVEYRQIEEIEKVSGVKEVVIERIYEPFEAEEVASDESAAALARELTEYTGAGSRIAIVDSGVNDKHQAFNADTLDYALRQFTTDTDGNGSISDDELNAYKTKLNFMLKADVEKAVQSNQLHVAEKYLNADQLYQNGKIPFAYNYADNSLSVQNDGSNIHGSHVAGIAAANTYLSKDGAYVKADEAGAMTGTAPDAQILNMKVFGHNLCTDSVIAAAIEDAVVLKANVLNLSLGTAELGFSCADNVYGDILDKLTNQGILVMGAVGNDGSWIAENSAYNSGRIDKLYADDVNLSTTTPPSSYADFMGVAWADGNGSNGISATVNDSSSYGIPSSLMLQPEITAAGTAINSVDGSTTNGYKPLSGTSMAAPDVTGAAAVLSQYLQTKQTQFENDSFLNRALKQNNKLNKGMIASGLLMSASDPMRDSEGRYYSLLRQGAGLLNVKQAVSAKSFIEIAGQPRGRVKAEVGDSPDGSNAFTYTFTLHNVSDVTRSYRFKTDLFTEDIVTESGINYLADATRELPGTVTYKIGENELDFYSAIDADVDGNGTTDANDAQALLDYLSGQRNDTGLYLMRGDADHDGKPTTYDAHLILKNLETSAISVAANDSITVEVKIKVTENVKENYPNGTYLEGFTSVVPIDMGEEEVDITHTIPILGFCGNWSDPSMFDRNSYIESVNDTNDTVPYTMKPSDVYDINYLIYQDKEGKTLRLTTNPYENDKNVPMEKLAQSLNNIIYSVNLSLIRPAGAICFAVMTMDQNGNRTVQYMDNVYVHYACAFPAPTSGSGWNFTPSTISIHTSLAKMLKNTNVQEGDVIELGVVAVPEYYEKEAGTAITKEHMKSLIEEGKLGKGAYLTTKVTLDSKAPEVDGDPVVTGNTVNFTVTDNQHVAYVGLYSANGQHKYGGYAPESGVDDRKITYSLNCKELQNGAECALIVGDYAGNTRMYRFTWGNKPDLTDRAIAYVRSYNGSGQEINRGSWLSINPKTFSCSNWGTVYNMFPFAYTEPSELLAGADAADNWLWQAFEDGLLYAAPLDDLNKRTLVCDLGAAGMQTVRDLAFSTTDKKLYATDGTDTLWQIEPMLGDVKAVQKIKMPDGNPASLYGLAVGDNGTVYSTSYDETNGKNSLLAWSLTETNTGAAVEISTRSCSIDTIKGRYISLTWKDKNRDSLYAACAENLENPSNNNYMYFISGIDVNSGHCNVDKSNQGDITASRLNSAVRGLVHMPAMPTLGIVNQAEAVPTELTICGGSQAMMAGDTLRLFAAVSPWNAEFNGSMVTWRSDKADIVSVDASGLLTAVAPGEAKITASYTIESGQTLTAEWDVTVEPAPSIQVTALFREGNGSCYWETFNTATPNDRKRVSRPQARYITGTLNQERDCLYLIQGLWGYRVNPATFKTEPLESSLSSDYNHGDAAPGRLRGNYNNFGYLTIIKGRVYLLGGDLNGYSGFETVAKSLSIADANLSGSMAGICYKEYVSDYSNPVSEKTDKGADVYYALTESGELHEIYIYEAPVEYKPGQTYDQTQVKTTNLGKIEGVDLPGVSAMKDDATASMIYDEASQKLVLVSKIKTGTAKVQVIDPESRTILMTREFDDDVRQIGILYQYDYSDYPDLTTTAANTSESVSTHAVGKTSDNAVTVNEKEKTVTFDLTVDNTTNGLTSLTYDPNVLTFSTLTASMPYHSFSNDAESGTVKFAFADADAIQSAIAHVTFTYELKETEQTATLTFNEEEKGDPKDNPALDTWTKEITLPAKAAERSLQSIEISHKPTKTSYLEGDAALDTTGLEVTAHYSNGTYEKLESDAYTVSGYKSTPGTHTITVTYQDKIATFEIEVKAKSLASISVSKTPDKLEYLEGKDSLDVSGGRLTLQYNNNTSEEIDLKLEMVTSTFDNTKVGSQTVEVSYLGKTTSFEVTVISKTLVSVSVSKNPNKMEYIEGTTFDDSGMELTLQYDNGTTQKVTTGWKIDAYDFSIPGQKDVAISYGGETTTLTVTVTEKALIGIKVTTPPKKQIYLEDSDELDISGGRLTLYYNNGTNHEVELSADMVTGGFDSAKPGIQTVTVTYSGFTAAFEVTVQSKDIERIVISRNPDKMEYVEETKFEPKGMEITVYYNNGKSEILTEGWETAYIFDTVGTSNVTFSYQGHDAVLTVDVVAKTLTRIEVTKMPNNTEYTEKSEFDSTGMEVTLYYDNGTTQTITEGWTVEYDFSVSGKRKVKVRYGDIETALSVTVKAAPQQPTNPGSNPNNKDNKSPETGDDSHLYIWLLLMLASGGMLALFTIRSKSHFSD